MATTLQRGGSSALASAKPVVAEIIGVLRPTWEAAGHPRRSSDGHNEIKITSLMRLDDTLRTRCGLRRVRNDGESPERPGEFNGGRQLFYLRGNVLVRVKTRGTRFRPRAHVTVSMCDIRGVGDKEWHAWDRERAKFTANGHPEWKNVSDGGSSTPYSFPTRIINGLTPGAQDKWADNCHFDLPEGFDPTGESTLLPE
ncbi:MAG: hypothetical protein M3552_10735 [Planctomycetota bacterium]|nr:hypothetical protein [Planctomycetaceae bacterium]MDQ3331113.1 hypothetical protein [Planctomycetota bacterium]